MPLILTLTHLGGAGNRETRSVSQGTFSIGRAPNNDWVLADPDRHLSKTHCLVSVENGRYLLTDVSTNGVFVNGSRQPAGRDAAVVLTDGDEFRMGDYSIAVSETPDLGDSYGMPQGRQGGNGFGGGFGGTHPDPFSGAGPVPGYSADDGPLGGDPLLNPFGASPAKGFQHPQMHVGRTTREIDPFDAAEEDAKRGRPIDDDDLFSPPAETWKGGSEADHLDAQRQSFTAPKIAAPVAMTDMDFDDLLGDLPPPGVAPAAAPASQPRAPAPSPFAGQPPAQPVGFDDLSLDDLLGDAPPGPAAAPPPAPVPAAPAVSVASPPPPPPAAAASPVPAHPPAAHPPAANPFDEGDFDDLLGGPPTAPAAPSPGPSPGMTLTMPMTLGTPAPAAPAPMMPGPPPAPVAAAAPPAAPAPAPAAVAPLPAAAPPPVAATGGADAAALWALFLEGAGVPALKTGEESPEASLRAAGQLFRIMVEGLREVLMSRAAIKSEMRVEQTVIRARDNNALKFSVTADEAVSAMLMPSRPGYKPPLDASREAFADIKSHELAVMAGMQTALMSLLKRFDPETIEKRLQPGKLDGFLPGARKARIWELFCATYKDLAKEAEDDFQSVFGNEFARAYDAQMRKF